MLLPAAVVLSIAMLVTWMRGLLVNVAEDGGFLPAMFNAVRSIPFVSRWVGRLPPEDDALPFVLKQVQTTWR